MNYYYLYLVNISLTIGVYHNNSSAYSRSCPTFSTTGTLVYQSPLFLLSHGAVPAINHGVSIHQRGYSSVITTLIVHLQFNDVPHLYVRWFNISTIDRLPCKILGLKITMLQNYMPATTVWYIKCSFSLDPLSLT